MSDAAAVTTGSSTPEAVSFWEATRLWAKVGFLSFGGAAGQIAMLHKLVVDERRWLDERTFINALNYCTLLPGPEAQQLATYVGWRLHGVRGGVVAGALFVIPGAFVMLGLSLLYVMGRGLTVVDGLFLGIKAAVLAIVLEAIERIGRRALRSGPLVILAIASFAAILVFDAPFPAVIVAAALIGSVLGGKPAPSALSDVGQPQATPSVGLPVASLVCAVAWWFPVALAAALLGASHVLVDLGLFFSKLAVVTFGGAYAVLAYLADAAVETKRWVVPSEMIDGLGLAETTPGPTILVNQFVGFLAAYRMPDPFTPLVAGILGALITTWVTFAPSFLWIFAGAPYLERIVGNRRLAGALSGITAAVVGVIATLAVTFGLRVLFGDVGQIRWGAAIIPWPQLGTLKPDMALLSLLAALLLFRWHVSVVKTIVTMALTGLAFALARSIPWG